MTTVRPFKAFLADPKLAAQIMEPPYDVVNEEEAKDIAGKNEFSFFRVSRAEIELPPGTDVYSDAVYKKSRENLDKFIANKWIIEEATPLLYVYAQRLGCKTQYGIMAEVSIIEYEKNIIKRHEHTREKKMIDRLKCIEFQNSHSEPTFLTYTAVKEVDEIVNGVCLRHPYINFIAPDGVEHLIWKMNVDESKQVQKEFKTNVNVLYIADGHHRMEASYRFYLKKKEEWEKAGKHVTGEEDFCHVMSLVFPSDQLNVWDYNRVIKDLHGKTAHQIVDELKAHFTVTKLEHGKNPKPPKKGHFSMYLENEWYSLVIKPELVDLENVEKSIDTELLTKHCLEPIFGIKNLRVDERIDFVGGMRGLKELEDRCHKDCKVAFACYPVHITEVMKVSDAGGIMPPKSTWFEPKPRSGGILHMMGH